MHLNTKDEYLRDIIYVLQRVDQFFLSAALGGSAASNKSDQHSDIDIFLITEGPPRHSKLKDVATRLVSSEIWISTHGPSYRESYGLGIWGISNSFRRSSIFSESSKRLKTDHHNLKLKHLFGDFNVTENARLRSEETINSNDTTAISQAQCQELSKLSTLFLSADADIARSDYYSAASRMLKIRDTLAYFVESVRDQSLPVIDYPKHLASRVPEITEVLDRLSWTHVHHLSDSIDHVMKILLSLRSKTNNAVQKQIDITLETIKRFKYRLNQKP